MEYACPMSGARRSKGKRSKPIKRLTRPHKKGMGSKPQSKKAPRKISSATAANRFAEQRAQERARRTARDQKARALAARDGYKPRKKDRGKFVFVGTKGKAHPEKKGRKGYLLYITKSGKKWLMTQKGRKSPYQSRKFSEIEPTTQKNLRKRAQAFQRSKLVEVSKHKAAVKGKGKVDISGAWDFNDKVVRKIANSLKRTIEKQAAKRTFLIDVIALVELRDKSTRVFQFSLPIDKPDHIAIEIGGMMNFVSQKFYTFLAKELAYAGFVSSGSANHIRHLEENEDAEPGEYTKNGEDWEGNDLEMVHIKSIEWSIKQAQ